MGKSNMFSIGLSLIIIGIVFVVLGTSLVWLAHKASQSFEPRPMKAGHWVARDVS